MSSLTNYMSLRPVPGYGLREGLCLIRCANDQCRSVPGFFFQRSSQNHVCLIVKSGKTIVEYIDFRILGNGSGNRQTLFLTAGHVGSSLGNRIFQSIFLFPG